MRKLSRPRRILLILFLGAAFVSAGAIVWFFDWIDLSNDEDGYFLIIKDSVDGLAVGAPVKVWGLRAGRVSSLKVLEQGGVRAALEMEQEYPIYANARAYIKMHGVGVTGIKHIDIVGGSRESGIRAPGSEIEISETPLQRASGRIEEIADGAASLLARSNDLMGRLNAFANALDPERFEELISGLETSIAGVGGSMTQIEYLVKENRQNIRRAFGNLEALLDQIRSGAETADRVASVADDVLSRIERILASNEDQLRATIANLRRASENFKMLSQKLERRPSQLLFDRPPKERDLP